MRIKYDVNKCAMSGQCAATAPEIFEQSDDGTILVRDETPPSDLLDRVRDAANLCPTQAITIEES
jgi:ferredoxin